MRGSGSASTSRLRRCAFVSGEFWIVVRRTICPVAIPQLLQNCASTGREWLQLEQIIVVFCASNQGESFENYHLRFEN